MVATANSVRSLIYGAAVVSFCYTRVLFAFYEKLDKKQPTLVF